MATTTAGEANDSGVRVVALYRKVLAYADTEPEASLVFARKLAEMVCLDLLRDASPGPRQRRASLEDLLREGQARRVLPPELLPPLRAIQNYGNVGAHEQHGFAVTPHFVQPCLQAAATLTGRYQALRSLDGLNAAAAEGPPCGDITVAESGLTVVRAIQVAWDLDRVVGPHGLTTRTRAYPWSDRLLDDLQAGVLDLAIYNRAKAEAAIAAGTLQAVRILGSFGHSMGGGNFYLMARRDGRFASYTYDRLRAHDGDVRVAVPAGSDIAENVRCALACCHGEPAPALRIVDIPATSGLEVFRLDPDILVSAGQNLRMLARASGDCVEIVDTDSLSHALRPKFIARAENCLLASARLCALLPAPALAGLHAALRRNVAVHWHDEARAERMLEQLAAKVDLDGLSPEQGRSIVGRIVYETYRFGRPCP